MKTLREHHYETRIAALQHDLDCSYGKRMVAIELLALEKGWKHLCDSETINYKMENIYHA